MVDAYNPMPLPKATTSFPFPSRHSATLLLIFRITLIPTYLHKKNSSSYHKKTLLFLKVKPQRVTILILYLTNILYYFPIKLSSLFENYISAIALYFLRKKSPSKKNVQFRWKFPFYTICSRPSAVCYTRLD